VNAAVAPWAVRYARLALGAAFLSAVGSRLGLWGHNSFEAFERYTAEVNSFMPAFTIPFLARAATVLELALGLGLIAGAYLRWVALAAAGLLALFGTAMAVSFGPKSPLDYSVFSASAGALLLSLWSARPEARPGKDST
jgi:putative oxidoreductase